LNCARSSGVAFARSFLDSRARWLCPFIRLLISSASIDLAGVSSSIEVCGLRLFISPSFARFEVTNGPFPMPAPFAKFLLRVTRRGFGWHAREPLANRLTPNWPQRLGFLLGQSLYAPPQSLEAHMPAKSRKTTKKPAKAAKPTPAPAVALVPGTVLRKLDRAGKVRCECTVEAGGYRYEGKVYGSLSGAAAAAAKKLQLTGKSFNGYVFWGLKQPGGRERDSPRRAPLAALQQRRSRAAENRRSREGAGPGAPAPTRCSDQGTRIAGPWTVGFPTTLGRRVRFDGTKDQENLGARRRADP
jgi:Protein of unknown function (DUF2924)